MLQDHVPRLLARARSLLRLPGGPAAALGPREVTKAARAVSELHEGLIGDRALAHPATYRGELLGAYLLWWWPQTYAKVQSALRGARLEPGARILDLGAGPGPAAVAALDAGGARALCIDANGEALAEARALGQGRLETETRDLATGLPTGSWDVVLFANVLSELPDSGEALLRAARARAPRVVIVEPALRETGRALLGVRDRLLADGTWVALAPCLTQKPCPALAAPRDWCTAEEPWAPPEHVRQLAAATGLRADERLSFAGLVLADRAPVPEPSVWRVVGVPPPEKGKRRLFLCNDQGRVAASRLDRDASDANAAFDRLRRGSLVRLGATEKKGDGLRLGPATAVVEPEGS